MTNYSEHTDQQLQDEIDVIRAEQDRRMILRDTPEQILYGVERFLTAGGSLTDLSLTRPEPEPQDGATS